MACEGVFFADPAPAPAAVELHLTLPDRSPPPGDGPAALPLATEADGVLARVDYASVRVVAADMEDEPGGQELASGSFDVDPSDGEIRLSLAVDLPRHLLPVRLELDLSMGGSLLFVADDSVTLERARTTTAELAPRPVALELRLPAEPEPMTALGDTTFLEGHAVFATGDPIPEASLSWASRDPQVVEVSPSGVAVARGEGEARVVASYQHLSEEMLLPVAPVVVVVRIFPDAAELEPGESLELEAHLLDRRDNVLEPRPLEWASSDPRVAEVDGGLVTARAPGETVVSAVYGEVAGHAVIAVPEVERIPREVEEVVVEPERAVLTEVGGTQQFTARALDGEGEEMEGVEFEWASTDPEVAEVNQEGLARAVGDGVTQIVARAEGVEGRADLVVELPEEREVEEVVVEPERAVLTEVGGTQQFTARALDGEGEEMEGVEFEWASTDLRVAEVNQEGLARAVGEGVTQIVARAEGVEGSADLVVELRTSPPEVTFFELDPESVDLTEGGAGVQATVHTTPTDPAVELVNVRILSPSGREEIECSDGSPTVSGSTLIWECALRIAPDVETGTWRVSAVQFRHESGELTMVTGEELEERRFGVELEVTRRSE